MRPGLTYMTLIQPGGEDVWEETSLSYLDAVAIAGSSARVIRVLIINEELPKSKEVRIELVPN